MREIDNIVKEIYAIFSGNKPGEYLDACTDCCMSIVDARRLKTIPLKEIPLDLIIEYQGAAKPGVLDLSELKYFAPRILEFIKNYQVPSFMPEVALDRFGYIDNADWTDEERALLDAFAYTFFKEYIKTPTSDVELSLVEILIMFHKGNFDLNKILKSWELCENPISLVRFSELLTSLEVSAYRKIKVSNAFSDEEFVNALSAWLESDHTRKVFKQRIEKAIMISEDQFTEEEIIQLDWQYDLLESISEY